MTACSRATPTASRWSSTGRAARSPMRRVDRYRAGAGRARSRWPTAAARVPVFHADRRALSRPTTTRPTRSRQRPAMPAETIRRIAARAGACRLRAADHARHSLDRLAGRRHDKMVGRPVAMHAMRGISAHANGFQTCRTLHLLQILLGLDRLPRRLPLQAAVPAADAAGPTAPARPSEAAEHAADGRAARLPARARRICWSTPTASRSASTRPIRWDAPLAAHGLMHMVITNAAQRRSVPDRRAVHVHGQHELELVDEHAGDARAC